MSGHHRKTYFAVFIALGVLTAIEIFIPNFAVKYGNNNIVTPQLFGSFTPDWSSTALYALSIAKASLVGLFFMHLKFETKWLKFIAILPIIAGFYALMLTAEAFYRYWLEGYPDA